MPAPSSTRGRLGPRRGVLLSAAVIVATLLVGVTAFPQTCEARALPRGLPGPTGRPATAAAPAAGSCAVADARLVPACGVWWGTWPRTDATGRSTNDLPANLAALESAVGRPFDIVSRYKGWGEDLYDGWDVGLRASGHLVLEDLTARSFTTDTYTPWASIASGAYDGYLTRQARRAKAFGARTFLSFDQEPEQALERGDAAGSPSDFAAAYRHVHDVFVAQGATNVVWVWWVMGYAGHDPTYAVLWPGSAYVDWVAYDPYDFNTCHRTAARSAQQTITPWYRWIDAQPWAAGKPLMLAEFGSNGPAQEQWLADVPGVLRSLPRIRAAVQFDSAPGGAAGCDHRVTASASNLAGYVRASRDPYVNPVTARAPSSPPSPLSPRSSGTGQVVRGQAVGSSTRPTNSGTRV